MLSIMHLANFVWAADDKSTVNTLRCPKAKYTGSRRFLEKCFHVAVTRDSPNRFLSCCISTAFRFREKSPSGALAM